MSLIELSVITSIILDIGVDVAKKKLSRREAVIGVLKRLNIENAPAADDFEAIYAYTLVEFGIDKPEAVLNFFRHKIIIKAFKRALYENNLAILEKEAEGIIDWNKETGILGEIDYDPRIEFASFTAVFNHVVDNLRSPAELRRDQLIEKMHRSLEDLANKMDKLNDIESVRAESAQWLIPREAVANEAKETTPATRSLKTIRWLHLSDFHVGKDAYGQRQLFKYLLVHVRERVSSGYVPDFVFVTGDIANKGQDREYKEFYQQFLLPLLECLPSDIQERIFIVPGNHDVDRTQARALLTKDVLVRVPEFLDPTEQGQFERQIVLPRFKAYIENDLIYLGDHWINSTKGVCQEKIKVRGTEIGVVGVNTAWLSSSDDDRHNLSAGKSLLEDGLETIKYCDIKIVLGHHPIDWLLDTELEPVRAILGRHTAVYLHGHMHKGRAKYEEGSGYPYLALQSGASFQAREDEVWVNRFLWCELDLNNGEIGVEPLKWSSDHQNWVIDGDAFPPRFQQGNRWILPLPKQVSTPVKADPIIMSAVDMRKLEIPDGWNIVDSQYLKDRNKGLTPEQAISFFDGRSPIWREALAPQIPRRELVGKIVTDLETTRRDGGLRVTVLTGAAGEGKTTALLQIVSDLVSSSADWHVLWRQDTSAPLPAEFISRSPDNGTWLIVSDDAELIARRVYELVQNLKLLGRKNVQFLLCSRDTDWKAADVERLKWSQFSTFVTETLRGLTKVDAEKVVSAWALFGKDGLKTLDGLQFDIATTKLLTAAKSEELNSGEGSFFGAILQVRWGEGLKNHIDNLLSKLSSYSVSSGKTLLDAFAYISAMHAENLQMLYKEVLAEVLEIPSKELKKKVIGPLGEEAVIATTGRMVFTRHQAIAITAMQFLSEKFDIDVDDLYIELTKAASKTFLAGTFMPNPGSWRYLSSYFFDKRNQDLGIRLAQAVLEIEPNDPYLLVKLAQLYRKAGQPEKSIQVFRSMDRKVTRNERPFYFEWATSEGNSGNYASAAWLAAFSLSDQATRRPPDNENATHALTGMSVNFAELYDKYNNREFVKACAAASQLGLTLELDPKGKNWLMKNRARACEVEDVPLEDAIERIKAGIIASWEQRDDDLPDWITPGNKLNFNGLARLFHIS